MNMRMALCICIPTYNRKKYLLRLLKQLKKELFGLETDISVLVSDNCSDDGTFEAVKEFDSQYEITVLRNERNLGYDANVINCVKHSKTKYVWLMGDDDFFVEGRIKEMLTKIKSLPENVGGIFANYYRIKGVLGLNLSAKEFSIYEIGEYNRDFYIATYGANFVGCTIMNTDICRKIIENNTEITNIGVIKKNLNEKLVIFKDFIQQYLAFECAKTSSKFGVFPEPCVEYVGDGSFSTIEQTLSSTKNSIMRLREFEKYYPEFFEYSARPFLRSGVLGLVYYLIQYKPRMERQMKNSFYESADFLIAYYREHGDIWAEVYYAVIWIHKNVPLVNNIIWSGYNFAVHSAGRKTYYEKEEEKKFTDTRKTEF